MIDLGASQLFETVTCQGCIFVEMFALRRMLLHGVTAMMAQRDFRIQILLRSDSGIALCHAQCEDLSSETTQPSEPSATRKRLSIRQGVART